MFLKVTVFLTFAGWVLKTQSPSLLLFAIFKRGLKGFVQLRSGSSGRVNKGGRGPASVPGGPGGPGSCRF